MYRMSDTWMLMKPDFDKGIVVKKIFEDMIEYWCYDSKQMVKLQTNGKIIEGEKIGEVGELRSIVSCHNNPEHIRKDCPTHIVVSGIRFNNAETTDLNDYLVKTGRSK